MKILIYTLSTQEEPNNIRYIGKTNKTLKKRLARHICPYELKAITYKNSWLKSELAKGHTPIITLLDEVNKIEWEFWEKYWISQFKIWGFKLTNQTNGGQGFGTNELNASRIKTKKNNYTSRERSVCMFSKTGELLNTFKSIRETERITKINKAHIWGCCNAIKEHNTASGFVFVYEGNPFVLRTNKIANKNKIVIQKDKQGNIIREYGSVLEASKTTKITSSNISGCALKKNKTAGGYIWEYKN